MSELLSRFDPTLPFTAATTPPAAWYRDPKVYAAERERVFRRSWVVVARLDELVDIGAFVTSDVAGEPIVVVRGEDGTLRALANVCRHKATPVAYGCGHATELVCPYHGWRYALDGRLRSAPQLGGRTDFDRQALSLPELRLETWGHYVFVNADLEAPPLAADLAPLTAALDRTGWRELTWVGRKSWDIACNWKVYNDNYLDGGYHVPHLHPSLGAQLDLSSYRTELFERLSVQTSGSASAQAPHSSVDPAVRMAGGAIYAFVYPNLMLNRYGPVLDTNLVLPLGPDRCRVVFDFFFEDPDDHDFIAESRAQSDLTQDEDIAVSEQVQRGLASATYDRAPYAAPEIAIHHFHRLLAQDLQSG